MTIWLRFQRYMDGYTMLETNKKNQSEWIQHRQTYIHIYVPHAKGRSKSGGGEGSYLTESFVCEYRER